MPADPPHSRRRIVVAGGGVAAVEALLAIRDLIGPLVAVELIAPERQLVHRPSSVGVPFGFGAPTPLDIDALAARLEVDVRRSVLVGADPERSVALTEGGEEIAYDWLLIAVGAVPRPVLQGAVTYAGPADGQRLETVLKTAAETPGHRLVFALPAKAAWPLPLYELAAMSAIELRNRGVAEPAITVVTPEQEPLWVFGRSGAQAVREMLEARGVELRTGVTPQAVLEGALALSSGETIPQDDVIALPILEGPRLIGLPADEDGFLPIDVHGRLTGMRNVYAAGDATTFPIKQGGLATQQADAAVEHIALNLGARTHATPFRPVLRGLLLTGGAPLYLRAELSPGGEVQPGGRRAVRGRISGEASGRALWWPPGKVAGRYLAPHLATASAALGTRPLEDRVPNGRPSAPDHEQALELALLMAEEDARAGDYRQALHALDAALALGGGALPAAYAERRAEWQRELRRAP